MSWVPQSWTLSQDSQAVLLGQSAEHMGLAGLWVAGKVETK